MAVSRIATEALVRRRPVAAILPAHASINGVTRTSINEKYGPL